MVEPEIRLPGIYMALVVATMNDNVSNEIITGAQGLPPVVGSPLGQHDAEQINSPCPPGNCNVINAENSSPEKAGSGDCQPELPLNRLRRIAVDRLPGVAIGLQNGESFLPVGNRFGKHTGTEIQNSGHKGTRIRHTKGTDMFKLGKGGSTISGYVPIQIVNLSLEVKLSKCVWG
jgi:hypothetical protein